MSDLTGEDAFDRVLEAAMNARAEEKNAVDQMRDAESRARESAKQASDAISRATALEQNKKAAQPRLDALWAAADAYRIDASAANKELLSKALHATADAGDCNDGIPF
jgi:hypothetical protein